jgi:preprotein translocase subunit YajC
MRKKNKPDYIRYLNENLRENEYYVALFEVIAEKIDKHVGEPLSQLVRSRSSTHIKRGDYINTNNGYGKVAHVERVMENGEPKDDITVQLDDNTIITQRRRALQSRKTLIDGSVLQGFDYYSEKLTDEDYARVFDYVSTYWPKSGTPEFVHFIGFVKNLRLQMRQLWTVDLGDNATSSNPAFNYHKILEQLQDEFTPVWEGGSHYPTSHVEIEYDVIFSPNADLSDLIRMFYLLAPIHLVLERIIGAATAEIEVGAGVIGHIDPNIGMNYTWTPNIFLEASLSAPTVGLDSNIAGVLLLDNSLEELDPRNL